MEPEQITLPTPSVIQQQNPKWVGPIMAFFLPGSAHFLSGQRWTGILWFLTPLLLVTLILIFAALPGTTGFFYIALFFLAVLFLYPVALLVSSWRPTRRLGCFGWLLFIGAALLLGHVTNQCVLPFFKTYYKPYAYEMFTMNGVAMKPTLIAPSVVAPEVLRQDRIVVNKWLYRQSDPKRGDIAIFKPPHIDSNFSMRIVGLPGETVDIESPYVLINGKRLTNPPIFEKIASQQNGFAGYCTIQEMEEGKDAGVLLPLTLGPDEYFMMGDNSPYSFDSRFWGPVQRQNITGKVIRIFYPFNRIREVE